MMRKPQRNITQDADMQHATAAQHGLTFTLYTYILAGEHVACKAGSAAFERGPPFGLPLSNRKETRMTADSLQKQDQGADSRLFQKGQSGNPAGRRPGSRNRA